MNKEIRDVIIIGGGASGILSAIILGKRGLSVTILEQNKVLGKKLSITGNGKCNYTNLNQKENFYHTDDIKKVYNIINKLRGDGLIDLFSSFGIETLVKKGREFDDENAEYVYPANENAKEFVGILQDELSASNVKIKTNIRVENIVKSDTFEVETLSLNKKYTYLAKNVIIATGGLSLPSYGSNGNFLKIIRKMGHKVLKPLPSLTPLIYKNDIGLSGLRCVCKITTINNNEILGIQTGEVQFNKNMLSGIAVMQLSGRVSRALDEGGKVSCRLDFFRNVSVDELHNKLQKRRELLKDKFSNTFLRGFTYEKLAKYLTKQLFNKNKKIADITDKEIYKLSLWLKSFSFDIMAVGNFDVAQSTTGGVLLSEVGDNLESNKIKGLYFIGEVLNVDGFCGGYNLTWAFTSAYEVGNAINV